MKRIAILICVLCWIAIGLRFHTMNRNLAMIVPAPLEDEYTETVDWENSTPMASEDDLLPLPTQGDIVGTDLTLVMEWPTLASLNPKRNASKTKKR